MQKALNTIKRLLGDKGTKWVRPIGHGIKGYLAATRYGFPAKKLKIIGITGTKGKTTTATITGRLANLYGVKTGYITTAVINTCSNKGEFLNPFKMTSIDSTATQKYLAEMVQNGCEYAVLEMSSQGLEQNRHWGIFGFDEVVFLNIYPEHIEAHGSWENYKKAKSILFKNLKPNGVFLANEEFKESEEMWDLIPAGIKKTTTKVTTGYSEFTIKNRKKTLFKDLIIGKKEFSTNFITSFDILNCFFAIKAIFSILSPIESEKDNTVLKLAALLSKVQGVPGRMEWVVESGKEIGGKNNDESKSKISVLVDYAHEPESMKQLLLTLRDWKNKGYYDEILHIVSCDGVGRDDWKKPILGEISQKFSDYSILTTDNYEKNDNPDDIVNLLSKNLTKKYENKKYFKIHSRKDAFKKALEIGIKSNKKVIIVSTGVGSEQGLTQPDGKIPWDEREVWKNIFFN